MHLTVRDMQKIFDKYEIYEVEEESREIKPASNHTVVTSGLCRVIAKLEGQVNALSDVKHTIEEEIRSEKLQAENMQTPEWLIHILENKIIRQNKDFENRFIRKLKFIRDKL